jgi:hypothetical protein
MQLELDPTAISVLKRRRERCRNALRLNPGATPHGFGQNMLFCLKLVGIADMLPRTTAARSEERTRGRAPKGRWSDQFDNPRQEIGTFFGGNGKTHFVARAGKWHKTDLAIDATDPITAEGEFVYSSSNVHHVR